MDFQNNFDFFQIQKFLAFLTVDVMIHSSGLDELVSQVPVWIMRVQLSHIYAVLDRFVTEVQK